MKLRGLSIETMREVTGAWLDPQRDRGALEQVPELVALLPRLEAAHERLVRLQPNAAQQERASVLRELDATDARHDRFARGLYQVLSGFAELSQDAHLSQSLLELRDRIFPEGLQVIRQSYEDEVTHTRKVRESVTASDRDTLAMITAPGGNLAQGLDAWVESGEELGRLLEQHAAQVGQTDSSATLPPHPTERLRARYAWMRVVRAVVSVLRMDAKNVGLLARLESP